MFENVIIRGVHASRFIMSWVRSGGELHLRSGYFEFDEWLNSLGLDENEISAITEIARNGKLELETSAKTFLKNKKETK